MKIETKAKDNPRVIAIQKIYGKYSGGYDLIITAYICIILTLMFGSIRMTK